jgi:hypothetical protein
LIGQLQTARQADLQNAVAPDVTPLAQGDYERSAQAAEDAIYKVQQGQFVSRRDLGLATTVPPKTLTPEQREDYIKQLQAARKMDNQGVHDYTREPLNSEDYTVQAHMIDQTIRQLRSGEQVSWWSIQQALYVPPNP